MTYGRGAELNLGLNEAVKVSGGCWPRSRHTRTLLASCSTANAVNLGKMNGLVWTARQGGVVVSDRVQVRALMLGAVAGVAEGFLAARVLAQVRLLPRVAPQVDL